MPSLLSHLTRFVARFFAGGPRFRLRGLLGLTVGLAIDGVVSIAGEVAVGLSRWSLWNALISFLRCWTAEAGSQVFSSPGIFSKTPGSRSLVGDPILTLSHRPRYPELLPPCIPRYCHRRLVFPRSVHAPAPSLWCPVLAVIHGKHHGFSTS